jgi:iduronate 2-sulfatase
MRRLLPALLFASVTAVAATPNVLFVAVDDLKPLLGCYGAPLVKSPNIDRLAQRGTVFKKAYVMQAVCSPSRNAVLTGLRPESLKIYDLPTNFRKAAPDVVTLPQHFMQHGYSAHSVGKIYHVGHGNVGDPEGWSTKPVMLGQSYLNPATLAQIASQKKEAKAKGVNTTLNTESSKGPASESFDGPDHLYQDGANADEAIKRLRGFKERSETFFLGLGFLKPHLPFNAPKKYWELYQRSDFTPDPRTTLPDGAPSLAGHGSSELHNYTDIPAGKILPAEKQRELLHGYHAAVSYMDAQLGRVLDALDELGLAENTIIVLWGDHGWHLGDHGMWCKHSNFEQATRAPLIICAPGQTTAGGSSDAVVEFVDIYPTLCDLAGLPKPRHLQGYSLKPLLDGSATEVGDNTAFHVYPRVEPDSKAQVLGQTIRTARYRMVEWQLPGGAVHARELYDYELDPTETVNLVDKPEHKALVAELSGKLAARLGAPAPAGVTLQAVTPVGAAAPAKRASPGVEERKAIFRLRDADHDGRLSLEEFGAKTEDKEEAGKRFQQRDLDGDGGLSGEEFYPPVPLKKKAA